MALDAALPVYVPRARSLAHGLTARVGLTLVVGATFVARVVAAAGHPVPRLDPDEYLYTSIARALASGHLPAVRGQVVHFPALLEPVLAAPLQALFSPELAYRMTQVENALLMSLAAIPVYLLARRLSLSARYALGCAVFAVAIPDLLYSSFTIADPAAYPLVLGALCFAVAALERPRARTQLAFLALALLATLARVQYIVLPFAYVVAAVAIDRRAVLAKHRLPIGLVALAALATLGLGPARLLGIYGSVAHLRPNGQLVKWVLLDLFLLAMSTGIVLVPGALVALACARGRTERAFSALAVTFTACVIFQAALFASNGSDRFEERYLFTVLPLVPLAFGLYLKHGRPARVAVAGLSCVLFVAAIRIPLSGLATGQGTTDSPFLIALAGLEKRIGIGTGALALSFAAVLGAAAAVAVSRGIGARVSFGAAIAFAALASVAATTTDSSAAQRLRKRTLPANLSWIDATKLGDVTLVQSPGSEPGTAGQQLYWNRTVNREVLLGPVRPTDAYARSPRVKIATDGTMRGIGANILLDTYLATAQFSNRSLVARFKTFRLLSGENAPRLSLLELGRYADGWLAPSGRLTVWPDASGRTRGTLRFSLSLPPNERPLTIRFGNARYRIEPSRSTRISATVNAQGPVSFEFSAATFRWLPGMRAATVRATTPRFTRAAEPTEPVKSRA